MSLRRSDAPARWTDAVAIAAFALAVRAAIVAWAWNRIPPIADGFYYDVLARRLAAGLGYTWQWPDGSVTHAAHYPVGYPAFVGALYRAFGAVPGVAMVGNAIVGAAGVFATHRLASRGGSRAQAAAAALLVAVHPDLVSYTPALMTEGVAASLVALAMWLGLRLSEAPSRGRFLAVAVTIAAATYVRPQCILLAALLPIALPQARALRARWSRIAVGATAMLVASILLVSPWTARNCSRMSRCAFVSVNDGWNLLIGTDPEARGGWAEVKVPEACVGIDDEAEKNSCFAEAGRRAIVDRPLEWLALAPKKLSMTFDYAGAGPWYLRASNPDALSEDGKRILGGATVLFERLALVFALVAVARALAARLPAAGAAKWGLVVAVAGAAWCFFPAFGWVAVLALVGALGVLVLTAPRDAPPPPLFALTLVHLASTAAVHVVFFGSGRYAFVTFPAVTALAVFAYRPREVRRS